MVGLLVGVGSVQAAKVSKYLQGDRVAEIKTINKSVGVYKVVDGTATCYVTIADGSEYTTPNISCVK